MSLTAPLPSASPSIQNRGRSEDQADQRRPRLPTLAEVKKAAAAVRAVAESMPFGTQRPHASISLAWIKRLSPMDVGTIGPLALISPYSSCPPAQRHLGLAPSNATTRAGGDQAGGIYAYAGLVGISARAMARRLKAIELGVFFELGRVYFQPLKGTTVQFTREQVYALSALSSLGHAEAWPALASILVYLDRARAPQTVQTRAALVGVHETTIRAGDRALRAAGLMHSTPRALLDGAEADVEADALGIAPGRPLATRHTLGPRAGARVRLRRLGKPGMRKSRARAPILRPSKRSEARIRAEVIAHQLRQRFKGTARPDMNTRAWLERCIRERGPTVNELQALSYLSAKQAKAELWLFAVLAEWSTCHPSSPYRRAADLTPKRWRAWQAFLSVELAELALSGWTA